MPPNITFYDDDEGFTIGDGEDRIDWSKLVKLRELIEEVQDRARRRAIVVELLQALYGDELVIL